MKHTLYILTFFIILIGCKQRQTDFMDDLREDFAKQAERQNKEIYAWESKIEELYNRSDKNLELGEKYADSIIDNDKTLDKWKVSNLHSIIGEIYYDNDSIDKALKRFHISQNLTFDSPRNKANKAGCYIKKENFDKAMTLLEEAAEVNNDFKWYIGNLYEIQGEPKKAILEYNSVYVQDTNVYSYYNQRIQELKNNPKKLMTELNYKDRRKRTLILLKRVGSDANTTEIGRFELEKK